MSRPIWRALTQGDSALAAWLGGQSRGELELTGVPAAGWGLLAASLAAWAIERRRTLLVLVPAPDRFLPEVRAWAAQGSRAHLFAEVHVSFLDRPPAHDDAVTRRLEALAALHASEPALIVSSRRAMLRMTIGAAELKAARLNLRPGQSWDLIELASRLVELGYTREPLVEAGGQFALRGGILDVFPSGQQSPVRLEFVGSEIETLRVFDPENQRSIMALAEVAISPGRELLLGAERGAAAAQRLGSTSPLSELRSDVRQEWEEELARLSAGAAFPGVEFYSAYLDPQRASLLQHLGPDALILDLDPARQRAEAGELEAETSMLAEAESRDKELPAGFIPPLVALAQLENPGGLPVISTHALDPRAEATGGAGGVLDLGWSEPAPLVGNPRAVQDLLKASENCVVLASEQGERIQALLQESSPSSSVRALEEVSLDVELELESGLKRADRDLPRGLSIPSLGLELRGDGELFGRIRRPAARRSSRGGRAQSRVSLEFQPGEMVVHVDHGIARFVGMRLIDSTDSDTGSPVQREYLELEYADQDRLYVPVENLDRVQKYLGGGEDSPTLNRLGSGEWERARQKARRNVQDVADELLKLYAQREARAGFAFSADTLWQAELESSFPFEETPDQLLAMAEIKADMESERPMDRLLCGDVGFGKTELALRAAFKAVMSGRQVAVLAPTTVLAQQHFNVFSQRLKPYPVTIEVLSRFRTEEEISHTLSGLRAGAVDVVIGTHRLIQRDVRFKRLGLLIIDEEQRFGVMQKERLKKLRQNLDVLSLSATPIPRTLHMAISGIRDMSVVQTPPEDRQPIKTYVTADDDELVAEVVRREIARGGQVYYVHNRVRSIERAAERVARLVPSARIAIGHGQMEEDELARVMVEFAAGAHDVLVCTTIIESGLDIPNVNTMIVERADRFGLSQLYQLRGRVGRSGKRAYAYFLYDPQRSLTEAADKRLDVMQGLHELGQGFKIALRDLEIRGAGNLLGTEQHGAIAAVGFEMYLQMLQHSVSRLRGGEGDAGKDPLALPEMNLDLPLDHFVPRSYIRDERLRLAAYRELAGAESEAELDSHLRSLRDRYGPPPAQLTNLAFSLRIKLRGEAMGLRAVTSEGPDLVIRVDPDRPLDVEEMGRRFGSRLKVRPNRLLLVRHEESWKRDLEELLEAMRELYDKPRSGVGA